MGKVDQLLDEILESCLKDMTLVDESLEGKDKDDMIRNVEALFMVKNNREKAEAEIKAKQEELRLKQIQLEMELDENRRKAKESKRNFIKDICLGLTGIFVPVLAFARWVRQGLEFEKTGTVTSNVFRSVINKFKVF